MRKYVFNWFESKARKNREKEILKECNCICYCPYCKEPLNDSAHCKEKNGIIIYTCAECCTDSKWLFDAPVPILIEGQ